jgi:hypothetical protein
MADGRIAGKLPAQSTESEIMLVATGNKSTSTTSEVSIWKEEA